MDFDATTIRENACFFDESSNLSFVIRLNARVLCYDKAHIVTLLLMRAPQLVTHPGLLAHGITARTSNEVELDAKRAQLPRIWHRFYDEGWPASLSANANNGRIVGVYTNYESGVRGAYTVTAGVEILRPDCTPNVVHAVKVSPGEYLCFSAYGTGPHAMITAWTEVWDFFNKNEHVLARSYERAFTADFERYGDSEYVSIYVAVKRKLGVSSVQYS